MLLGSFRNESSYENILVTSCIVKSYISFYFTFPRLCCRINITLIVPNKNLVNLLYTEIYLVY